MKVSRLVKGIIIFACVSAAIGIGSIAALSAANKVEISDKNKTYSCVFYNYDEALLYSCKVKPSHDVVYRGIVPSKPNDEQYSYDFVGWDYSLNRVDEDKVYHAQFKPRKNDYVVTFVNYDYTTLYTTTVQYGQDAVYVGDTPTRPAGEKSSYVFSGWDEDLHNITEDTTFIAQYDETLDTCRVYFFDYDETLIYVDEVPYGGDAKYDGIKLTGPEAQPGYKYTFSGWSDSLTRIKDDKSVIALYDLERVKYEVSFIDYNGNILYIDEVYYGESAQYRGNEPYRPSDESYSYEFIGWDGNMDDIRDDTEIYATYATTNPSCRVTFKNYNGEVLEEQSVQFGKSAVYSGETPVKPSTEKYDYEFVGWDRNVVTVTTTFSTYAVFEEHIKEFDVRFLNYDNEEIKTYSVPYGTNMRDKIDFPTPERPEDENYTYVFKGWSEDIDNITKDLEPVAIYDAIPKKEVSADKETGTGGDYGDEGKPIGPPQEQVPVPPGTMATVQFNNYDGTELDHDGVFVGRDAHYDVEKPIPTREADKKYSNYVFTSWDHNLTNVQKSFATYAQYVIEDDLFTKYIVSFRNDDGGLLYECVCDEGEMPTIPESFTPISKLFKNAIFIGWDRTLTKATSSYTVYAVYQPVPEPVSGGVDGDLQGDQDSDGIFNFKTSYKGHIYFRERSFGNMENNQWKAARQFVSRNTTFSPLYLTNDLLQNVEALSYSITIHYNDFTYYPAMPYYSEPGEIVAEDDVNLKNAAVNDFTFKFATIEFTPELLLQLKNTDYSQTYMTDLDREYYQYAKNNYLEVSPELQSTVDHFISANSLQGKDYADILRTRDIVSTSFEYDMGFTKALEGENAIKYFMETSKKGVCSHFASALTMIYRAMGIPARYTVGYSSTAKGDADLQIGVTGMDAHAWTEIYLPGIGWICVDATPGGGSGAGNSMGQGGGGGGGGKDVSSDLSLSPDEEMDFTDLENAHPVFSYLSDYFGLLYFKDYSCADIKPNHAGWVPGEPKSFDGYDISPYFLLSDKLKQAGKKEYEMTVLYDQDFTYPDLPSQVTEADYDINDCYGNYNGERSYNYKFIPYTATVDSLKELLATDYSNPHYSELDSSYYAYAKEKYLTVPEEYKEFLAEFIEENGLSCDTIEGIIDTKKFISTYCDYNLQFPAIPEGEDPMIYFLTESREGICNHFATALTMLYRYMGIPARFTVGYASRSKGSLVSATNVISKEAHAWTEIYIPGAGWVIADGTGTNNISPDDGEGQEMEMDPYNPFGPVRGEPTLTINIKPEAETKAFDGKEMLVETEVIGEFLQEGDHIEFKLEPSSTTVGSYVIRAHPRILDSEGKDVTRRYVGKVALNYFEYSITPLSIEIKTASDEKVRDGTPLTCEEFEFVNGTKLVEGHEITFEFTGIQTKPGQSSNTIALYSIHIVDEQGRDVTSNYAITITYGKLVIK